MAFISRIGSTLKQAGSKHASRGLSASSSSLYQTIRMSSSKLLVDGLAYSTDENGLKQAFDQYGQVIEAKVATDHETGRSRGFGFISFTSSEEANKALREMDGQELHGQRVRVYFATEKPRPAYNNFGGGDYGGVGSYVGGGSYNGGNLGGYGDRDNAGKLDSPPSFDAVNNETPTDGGAEQSGGFQGDVSGGGFGGDCGGGGDGGGGGGDCGGD